MEITRPAARYFGGKWRLGPKILPLFPPHETYVEPFGGAASLLLQKPLSLQEVYNDLDHEIVNFFQVLREHPDDLVRAIQLTPYARHELEIARVSEECSSLEKARRFYVRSWMSFGSASRPTPSGWRMIKELKGWGKSVVDMWNQVDHLQAIAWRFKQVHIECQDALKVIRRWDSPKTLFYIDPPYEHSTRTGKSDYAHEMTDQLHEELAVLLHDIKGMVAISGNPSPLYEKLYGDWQQHTFSERGLRNVPRLDCLWLSPKATTISNLPLFGL